MEVCNRYPVELEGIRDLDQGFVNKLRYITNIRPALATPLWITGQIQNLSLMNRLDDVNNTALKLMRQREKDLRGVWDKLAENFLQLDFVRREDKPFKFDVVNKMAIAIKISKAVSSKQIDSLIYTLQNKSSSAANRSFAEYALKEQAFIDNKARYIVYGHTHYHETVPLDYDDIGGNQIYFNSGTWHTYFDLARKNPTEKKFIPYKALTYITFYKDEEHEKERKFETWSGAYA
jgi:UDP-2,3-diacylglucosamine pyrophosphatase LpxH